jgi:transposase-like protein
MPMSSTDRHRYVKKDKKSSKIKKRRHWPLLKKINIVEETKNSNATVCSVARKHEISPNLLSLWRRLDKEGKLKVFNEEEEVVPVSAVKHLQTRIQDLERIIEKKKKEIENLRATKSTINDLEKYPNLRMAIKYNLLGDINIWISK